MSKTTKRTFAPVVSCVERVIPDFILEIILSKLRCARDLCLLRGVSSSFFLEGS